MDRTTRIFRDRLCAGEVVVGTWAVMPSPWVAEVLASAGFDFIVVDMEHGPTDFAVATEMIRAAEIHGCAPLVRVPALEESAILRALDIGPTGLLVPQIQSGKDVELVIQYSKYPPIGRRGHSPFTRSGGFSHHDAATNIDEVNRDLTVGILVEGTEGISAFEEILGVGQGEIDLVYIGLYDLAKSMGHPGDIRHPEVTAEMMRCVQLARESNIATGTIANSLESIDELIDYGVQMIAFLNDTGILYDAVESVVKSIRR